MRSGANVFRDCVTGRDIVRPMQLRGMKPSMKPAVAGMEIMTNITSSGHVEAMENAHLRYMVVGSV